MSQYSQNINVSKYVRSHVEAHVCELLLSVLFPSNVMWWLLNMSISRGRRIWMRLHSRLWFQWTDPSCVYRYDLHSNFTLESMITMIFKITPTLLYWMCGPWVQWLIFPSNCRELMKYVMSYKCFHYVRHHLFLHFPGVSKWFTGLWEPSTALIRNPVVTLS